MQHILYINVFVTAHHTLINNYINIFGAAHPLSSSTPGSYLGGLLSYINMYCSTFSNIHFMCISQFFFSSMQETLREKLSQNEI